MNGGKLPYVVIVEKVLGKTLPKGAIVHHIDGNNKNNDKSNLCVLQNKRIHNELHRRKKVQDAGGDFRTQKICTSCKKLQPIKDFCQRRSPLYTDGLNNICTTCVKEKSRKWRTEKNPERYREYKKEHNAARRVARS